MRRFHMVSRKGFSLVELFIVVAMICVLIAVFLPEWVENHRRSSRLGCVNNLKQIGLGFKVWALDHNDIFPMRTSVTNGGTMELVTGGNVWPHFLVMSNELSTPKILFCPQEADKRRTMASTFMPYAPPPGAAYTAAALTNDIHVSYFVGVDAEDKFPNMVLAGDHNLLIGGKAAGHGLHAIRTNTAVAWRKPMHHGTGNILLVDGSVQTLNNSQWTPILVQSGAATNRLAVP